MHLDRNFSTHFPTHPWIHGSQLQHRSRSRDLQPSDRPRWWKRGSQAIDRDANGRHGAVSVSLSFGVVCCVRSFGIVLWDFAGFPECFSALSSGRTTARAATKFHEKDLSHTQLRVSAPLNSPLRSQVARSALRRLSLPVFSPFPLLALLLSLVLLCVVFFTRSPLPTPARLRFCACVLLRAVSCRCRLWQWRWCRRRRVESPLGPPPPPCCCGCWAKALCAVNFSS